MQLEVEREGQTNDIEARTDVGGREGRFDNEGGLGHGGRGEVGGGVGTQL